MVSAKSKQLSALNLNQEQLDTVCSLLVSKTPIPYIAKRLSHLTGGLRDYQLRQIESVYERTQELAQRKQSLLDSLNSQQQLTDELKEKIDNARDKSLLSDIAYPYRAERRNLAHFASTGPYKDCLEKLTSSFENQDAFLQSFEEEVEAQKLLSDLAILLAEATLKNTEAPSILRKHLWNHSHLQSRIKKGRESVARMVRENISIDKKISQVNPQEGLAIFRARSENINEIHLHINIDDNLIALLKQSLPHISTQGIWFDDILKQCLTFHLLPKFNVELLNRLKEHCENSTLKMFTKQLHQLITQTPAGPYTTMGIVNGFKAGVKVVIVDGKGALTDSETIFPLYADGNWHDAQINLAKMITKHHVKSIAIAKKNGAKDILRLVNELNETYQDLQLVKLIVSDAGAKTFAHTDRAIATYPELDEWQREAVSIAKRLQDPISELASLPLATIDVGINQQAINAQKITTAFHAVMEDSINKFGVDINVVSKPVLSFICGLNQSDVDKIIAYRKEHGSIPSWDALKSLELSNSALSYASHFIKISNSENPLDKTFIGLDNHALATKIADSLKTTMSDLLGNKQQLKELDANQFVTEEQPLSTVQSVIRQLERPPLATRNELKPVQFNTKIKTLADLNVGDILNGVVGNITTFGAFVNIGIDQDGLIHTSEMPSHAKGRQALLVKTGDVVKVKVIAIDDEKKRLNLSLKLGHQAKAKQVPKAGLKKRKPQKDKAPVNSAMADALLKLNLTK